MNNLHFSQDQLVQVAKLSDVDMALIDECRGEQNKLGLGYQLGFVHLFNQFPAQVPFEPIEDLVTYMSLQLDIAPGLIEQYKIRRETIAEHRTRPSGSNGEKNNAKQISFIVLSLFPLSFCNIELNIISCQFPFLPITSECFLTEIFLNVVFFSITTGRPGTVISGFKIIR
jgi:hypothetical protein